MRALVSHPTGNANLRAVLRALAGIGELSEFWTTVAVPPNIAAHPWVSDRLQRRLSQRSFAEVSWGHTRVLPGRELVRLVARRARISGLTRHETGWASVDAVYRGLDRAVARRLRTRTGAFGAVYAYEDGAYDTFEAARETGCRCVYDLPIVYWRTLRRLLEEEADRLPDWAPTMEGLRDSTMKLERKDAELALAEHVVVASSFTRDSVRAAVGDRPVVVTPYGCPPPPPTEPAQRAPETPIELLFVGHLNQRKGIADLIAALALLDVDWRLTLAGPRPEAAPPALDRWLADDRVTWLGTVPHATVLEHMAKAHLFVFPSIVEGFGMVITEALSAGLPVITTPHTAGPDILTEGVDGFIVPIRSPDSLAARITAMAEDEPKRYSMAMAARDTARQRNWRRYERQIAELLTGWMQTS